MRVSVCLSIGYTFSKLAHSPANPEECLSSPAVQRSTQRRETWPRPQSWADFLDVKPKGSWASGTPLGHVWS